ncbi:ATP-binding protein [Streptomyces erythrochromogenes]|uniref:ATP-binding protein n=1 Tax=Streptomyces erythrochromogenes TaxID=285574 RepID=UPI0036BF2B8F
MTERADANPVAAPLKGLSQLSLDAGFGEPCHTIAPACVPVLPSGCSCEPSHPRTTFTLPGNLYSTPSRARRKSLETLSAWGASEECVDDVILVTSELVTNAVRHSASDVIVLTFELLTDSVRVSVSDQGSLSDVPFEPRSRSVDDVGGRGLFLVESVSVRWGTERARGRGAVVWAAIALAS